LKKLCEEKMDLKKGVKAVADLEANASRLSQLIPKLEEVKSTLTELKKAEINSKNQLKQYEKNKTELDSNKDKKVINEINSIKQELEKLKIKPNFDDKINPAENLKNLSRQLNQIKIKNIINDKNKNKIIDNKISDFIFRYQTLQDLPPKELRTIVDDGKKKIKKGVLIVFSSFEEKVGVSIGITNDLLDKFDAVELIKVAASILGGKGGGGRKDFAQAGGIHKNKIDEAFKAVQKKIS